MVIADKTNLLYLARMAEWAATVMPGRDRWARCRPIDGEPCDRFPGSRSGTGVQSTTAAPSRAVRSKNGPGGGARPTQRVLHRGVLAVQLATRDERFSGAGNGNGHHVLLVLRVGLVVDREHVFGLQPARRSLGAKLGAQLGVGGGTAMLAAADATSPPNARYCASHLERPRPRLGLRRARRGAGGSAPPARRCRRCRRAPGRRLPGRSSTSRRATLGPRGRSCQPRQTGYGSGPGSSPRAPG